MKKKQRNHNDFIVDHLTNSIRNRISGDSLMTEVSLVSAADIKIASKKNGWLFDWKSEFNSSDREIYKLTILNNLQIIPGLMSITLKPDHVFLNLIESAKFNRGAYKVYEGVPGN